MRLIKFTKTDKRLLNAIDIYRKAYRILEIGNTSDGHYLGQRIVAFELESGRIVEIILNIVNGHIIINIDDHLAFSATQSPRVFSPDDFKLDTFHEGDWASELQLALDYMEKDYLKDKEAQFIPFDEYYK